MSPYTKSQTAQLVSYTRPEFQIWMICICKFYLLAKLLSFCVFTFLVHVECLSVERGGVHLAFRGCGGERPRGSRPHFFYVTHVGQIVFLETNPDLNCIQNSRKYIQWIKNYENLMKLINEWINEGNPEHSWGGGGATPCIRMHTYHLHHTH